MSAPNLACFTTWAASAAWAFTLGHFGLGVFASLVAMYYAAEY